MEHPDPGHPSSSALNLEEGKEEEEEDEEEEEVEQNGDVMDVMNMEEEVSVDPGQRSAPRCWHHALPTSIQPPIHQPDHPSILTPLFRWVLLGTWMG